MADPGDVLGGSTVLYADARLANELARDVVDDVHTKQLVRLLVRQHLYEALLLRIALRTRVGHKAELTLLELDALGLQLLLRLPDPSHLRVGIDDGGHAVVVEMRRLARGQILRDQAALVLGLVRQHGPLDDIADGENARHVGTVVVIDLHLATFHLHTNSLEAKVVHELSPADANEDNICLMARALAPGRCLRAHLHYVAHLLHTSNLGLELELHALLLQERLKILRDLRVNAKPTDGIQKLDYCDLGSKPGPDGAELEADNTAADHCQLLRHLLQGERPGARHNHFLVKLDAWKADDIGSRCQHDVLGLDRLLTPCIERNLHAVRPRNGAVPHCVIHLVHLEEALDALRQHGDSLFLVFHHLVQIYRDVVDHDSPVRKVRLCRLVEGGIVQEALRGDASHVQASASQLAAALHTDNLEA
mmetsp:Transcript_135391/g.289483  ORF Transcript_135391/g.289483 Transcript_135391/m.289483 type:complete len:421 (+) Transcript_135391:164-1426(+)